MSTIRNAPLRRWEARGRRLDVFGRGVFVVDEGDGVPIVILHGYPSCSFDFHAALDHLTDSHRVVIHDHLGFGLSEKPTDYSYSLIEQADVAVGVWRTLGIERAHLVAHDYGTSVATELLARRERGLLEIELSSVTLCNGSMHVELCEMRPIQHLLINRVSGPVVARLAFQGLFHRQMRNLFGDPESVGGEELDALWEALDRDDGRAVFHEVSRYQLERWKFWDRWIGALERLDLPAHVVWGRRDPVAVAAIAEQLASEIADVEVTWLDDLGHYPMMEDPGRFAQALIRGLRSG